MHKQLIRLATACAVAACCLPSASAAWESKRSTQVTLMTELGQRSGELENMLIKVADTYDEDVQITIDAIVSLLEPVIIVVMGVFVGLLVLSILLPILNLSTNIG